VKQDFGYFMEALRAARAQAESAIESDKLRDYEGAISLYCKTLDMLEKCEPNFSQIQKEIIIKAIRTYKERIRMLADALILEGVKISTVELVGRLSPEKIEKLKISVDGPDVKLIVKRGQNESFNFIFYS
jgi:hypothetical protein